MTKWAINSSTLTDIANAVRAKRGTIAPIQVDDLADEIALIEGGGSEGLLRDRLIIPDKYNTGCHGELRKFNVSTDTSGLQWRDGSTTLDFNNGKAVQNLTANQVVVFEGYDFTDYDEFYFMNVQSYTSQSSYYRDNIRIVFVNCLFVRVRQDYEFNSTANIRLEFYNCSSNRFKVGNALLDRCLAGNVTFYQQLIPNYYPDGDAVNPRGPITLKNSYIMDIEASLSTASAGHLDGFQQVADPSGHDVHIFNCRFECFDMPYATTQGEWSYSMFWQGSTINSSLDYCILHGGGYYGASIRKASNQTLSNNLISGEYHCPEGAPESEWAGKACYPSADLYQMSDGWADYIRTLLVSSVWVENGKLKVCYSNNMHSQRTLKIVTDTGLEQSITVPACPIRSTAASEGVTKWADLPFDLIAELPLGDFNSVSIYDGTTLVRTFAVDTAGSISDLGTKSITQNGTYQASSDGLDGYSAVTVNVSGGVTPTGTLNINQNGTYDVTQYASAAVAVPGGGGSLPTYLDVQEVTPSQNSNTITYQFVPGKGDFIAMFIYRVDRNTNPTYTMNDEIIVLSPVDKTTITKVGGTISYNGGYTFNTSGGNGAITIDQQTGAVTVGSRDSSYPWKAGFTYRAIIVYTGVTT